MGDGALQERVIAMHPSRPSAWTLAFFIFAIGSFIVLESRPAQAACVASHQNVEGENTGNLNVFGNRGAVLVPASSLINYSTLNASIHRSVFIWSGGLDSNGKFLNDVEVGWSAHNGSHTNPTTYIEWVNNGVDSGIIWKSTAGIGSSPNYRTQDADGDRVWSFYVGSTTLGSSATMNFSSGKAITNSERRNTCDSGYAHFTSLKTCNTRNPCSWLGYGNLVCYFDAMGDYRFRKVTDSEHWVDAGSSPC